jgi:nitroreductase
MDAIEAILGRRTVPQAKMTGPGPSPEELRLILAAGAAAPDHGKLRPWRFLVIEGEARERLGALFVAGLLAAEPDAAAEAIEKQRTAALRVPLLIVVIARIDMSQGKIPEVERIASAAAAAQNMLLATHAQGLAGKWSTGRNAYDAHIKAGLGLGLADHLVGYLYIGRCAAPQDASPRPPLETLVERW